MRTLRVARVSNPFVAQRRSRITGVVLAMAVLNACTSSDARTPGDSAGSEPAAVRSIHDFGAVDDRCALPGPPVVLLDEQGTVLWTRVFDADDVFSEAVLPKDSAYLEFRGVLAADSALLRRPIADAPRPDSPDMAEVWRREGHNVALVFDEGVGSVAPITCLDALLFAEQHRRTNQLTNPTEFIANVLTRSQDGRDEIAVVFGAGMEMFPPKAVYGFEQAAEFQADGWRWSYSIHNHTVQANGDRLALGTPVPSTSDVDLMRGLIERAGLQAVRVTNGVYTFEAQAGETTDFIGR